MKSIVTISIKKISNKAILPTYATEQSAGADLYALLDEPYIIESGARALIPTGIAIALSKGYEAQIRPRSGLALNHGLMVMNSPGTIDADYRGEIKIILANMGDMPFVVEPEMRIAQMVIAKHEVANWQIKETLDDTIRSDGGFGSTGLSAHKL